METKRKFSLKGLFKTLLCEHEFCYKCSNCSKNEVRDYYGCRHCWKFITIVRPDFMENLLEEENKKLKEELSKIKDLFNKWEMAWREEFLEELRKLCQD